MNFSKFTKKVFLGGALSGACVAGLAACGPKGTDFSILGVSQGAFQSSVANNKVDILWVIKNSGTMLVKQNLLGTGFSSFIANFDNSGFDYQMGVITPDLTVTGQGAILQGAPQILTSSTANLSNTFATSVQVGDTGSFQQTPFDAVLQGLGATLLAGSNTGFIRSDAQLAVIFVADSDMDYSTVVPSTTYTDVYNYLNTLKPPIYDAVTKTYKPAFTVSGVIADDTRSDFVLADCSSGGIAYYENGLQFESLITKTSGSEAQICSGDFSTGLTTISNTIVQAITAIPLARVPDTTTIVITFNGVVVPEDATNGWSYLSSTNTIDFNGTSIPSANTAINISYTPNDIIR